MEVSDLLSYDSEFPLSNNPYIRLLSRSDPGLWI